MRLIDKFKQQFAEWREEHGTLYRDLQTGVLAIDFTASRKAFSLLFYNYNSPAAGWTQIFGGRYNNDLDVWRVGELAKDLIEIHKLKETE